MKLKCYIFIVVICTFSLQPFNESKAQNVDYSVISVKGETGLNLKKISSDNDYVCMPIVKRNARGIDWLSNRIIDVSKDNNNLAYVSFRNNATNIFIKDLSKQGASVQRTNRSSVLDFSYSPDGKYFVFSEAIGNTNQIFQTDSHSGYICRQITTGCQDYSPVYSNDMTQIFFTRQENKSTSIWSHNMKDNFLSSFTSGMNPCPISTIDAVLVTRVNAEGRGEIWRINYLTGTEECVVSDPNKSFTSPSISPDGQWILCVGSSSLNVGKGKTYHNTDIYSCHIDGSQLTQLTYHAADDLSPVWSRDGKFIYFISQRGSSTRTANIWRMDFKFQLQ